MTDSPQNRIENKRSQVAESGEEEEEESKLRKTQQQQQQPQNFSHLDNPIVFFDIKIGANVIGRMKIELFHKVCPKTSENFRQLCTGEFRPNSGAAVGYKKKKFTRVISSYIVQGGDIRLDENQNDLGIVSIYDQAPFDDENFIVSHNQPGIISMAKVGDSNKNGSEFFITCSDCGNLDGKYVAFGQILPESMHILRQIECVKVYSSTPAQDIIIIECGQM